MPDRNRPETKPITGPHPSDPEIFRRHAEAAKQYEDAMRIADLADAIETEPAVPVKYTWNHPIGLVVRNDPIGLVVRNDPIGLVIKKRPSGCARD